MSTRPKFRPFTGDTSRTILLEEPPLPLVLCQIRWPELSYMQGDLKPLAISFGEKIAGYPLFRESQELSFNLTPDGVHESSGSTVYQWQSIDGNWTVSLGRRFLSFHSSQYTNFEDFSSRFREVVQKLSDVASIPLIERVGVRYVNQITDDAFISQLGLYVSEGVAGYSTLAPAAPTARLVNNVNQALYEVEDVMLQVRSGIIPAGETVDASIQARNSESWILDMDAFSVQLQPFSVDAALETAGKLSDTAYDFFKLVTTDGFIARFGGDK
ncbi:TIGR04255 family protein [Clavibacter michiganensis]|uniref:TIGR04255 family protein n=1 Tax=Clavibacter michiganensis TaxID=28447 RepID=UPI0018682F7E|nr:TIGR04255 family protein [Clavibacter michiganensis]MBE3079421.1 TIGR04255 family protein [Clavibacter michiganensis subsp. michiganensis]MDO4027602.1 TIGR04255 family protein [Clavibacter michiganensis]